MDDLISREKAINTAHSMRKVCDTDNIDDYHELMIAALMDLPSADAVEVVRQNLQLICNQLATDCISRKAAIKAVHEEFDECLVWDESGQQTADEVESILTSLPSADAVKVRRGTWIKDRYNNLDYVCSECGEPCADMVMGKPRDRYCKWCGARMGGEQNG